MQQKKSSRYARIILMVLIVLMLPSLTFAQLSLLKGTVKTKDGKPLTGVYVYFSMFAGVETDQDGIFKLSKTARDQVISFKLQGHQPLSIILEPKTDSLNVILEEVSEDSWVIPACSEKENKQKRKDFLYPLMFLIPGDAKIKSINDIDYSETFIGYKGKDKPEWLKIMDGSFASSGRPLDRLFLASKQFNTKMVKLEDREWVDYRGITIDGKHWRWFGGISFVSYETPSDEAAEYFDKIIDSACWRESKRK